VRKKKRKIHAGGAATPFRIEVLPLAASFSSADLELEAASGAQMLLSR